MAAGVPTPRALLPRLLGSVASGVTNGPCDHQLGGTFTIDTPNAADMSEVVLLRAGAVTHGYNMSQRGIELRDCHGFGAGTVDVMSRPQGESRSARVVFASSYLTRAGVPSLARWIPVNAVNGVQAKSQRMIVD